MATDHSTRGDGSGGSTQNSQSTTEQSPSGEFVHPETGEVLASREDWMQALAAVEERMAPLYRLRRQLREASAERFDAAAMPAQRRSRTETQERVARCPRCGGRLESEGPDSK